MASTKKEIVGVLLAAGASSRFGSPKLIQPLDDGQPMIMHAALAMQQALPDSLVVVRKGDAALMSLLTDTGLTVIENPDAEHGMGSSLSVGVKARPHASGWLIGLADMPWIQAGTWQQLAETLTNGVSLCTPLYQGQRGHPVGFAAQWLSELSSLDGDQGARQILRDNNDQLTLIKTADPGVLRDVDTPADLTAN